MRLKKGVLCLAVFSCFAGAARCAEKGAECDEASAVHNWAWDDLKVIVCASELQPAQFKKDWWHGSGLEFYKLRNGEKIPLGPAYSAEMDYSFQEPLLTFITYTSQPNKDGSGFDSVPFIRETVLLDSLKPRVERIILLPKPVPDPAKVEELFSILSMPEKEFRNTYKSSKNRSIALKTALYAIRNYGLLDPEGIYARLSGLRSSWWDEGAMEADLRNVLLELDSAKALSRDGQG